MSLPVTCIYILVSPSGATYVGQTINLKNRMYRHTHPTKNDGNLPFHNAIKKYGIERFQISIIECKVEELYLFERLFIQIFKGIGQVYNLNDGGSGTRGFKHTPEQIEKMRINCPLGKGYLPKPYVPKVQLTEEEKIHRKFLIHHNPDGSLKEHIKQNLNKGRKKFIKGVRKTEYERYLMREGWKKKKLQEDSVVNLGNEGGYNSSAHVEIRG